MIILSYNGVIAENKTKLVINSIVNQIEMLDKRLLKAVLVSFKAAVHDNQSKAIVSMVKQFELLSQKLKISIALIDYSVPMYQLFKETTKNTKLQLFKDASAAKLFLNPKAFKKGLKVLVYDEDEANMNELSEELMKYGYSVIKAKDADHFQTLLKEKFYDVTVTQSAINMDLQSAKSSKSVLSLSKKLIANLPVFMDTAVETLVSFTGLEAQKSGHGVKGFVTDLASNFVSAVMHFKGDIEGSFVLVFPKDIAVIAMESLLGEKVDENDNATIMDGVGEFCNIITGSTKTALSHKEIKVLFELPRTYTSLQSTINDIGNENGIWIDMQLAGKPFYMFITK